MKMRNILSKCGLAILFFGIGSGSSFWYLKEKQYIACSELLVREQSGALGSLQGMLKRRQPTDAEINGAAFPYWLNLEVAAITSFLSYTAGAKALHEKGRALPSGSMTPTKAVEFPEFVGEFKRLNDKLVNFAPKRERLGRYLGVEVESSEMLLEWLVKHCDEIRVEPP
jgi:hypothetical protein